MAKPTPELLRAPLMICELTPMTSPSRLMSGPPLLPGIDRGVGLDDAADGELGQALNRAIDTALMMPDVSVQPWRKGLPMASTV